MADEARLAQALQNAHEAGDTEAARRLAQALREARAAAKADKPEPKPEPKPAPKASMLDKTLHVLKGQGELARGMLDIGPTLYNATKWAVGKIPENITIPGTGGIPAKALAGLPAEIPPVTRNTAVAPFFDAISGEVIDKDAYPVADAIRTFGQWANPVGSGAKINSAMNIVPAVAATVGEKIGGLPGEIIGGVTGAIASTKGKPPSASDRAAKFIAQNLTNEGAEAVSKGIANRERGTLADLAGEQKIYDIESAVTAGNANPAARSVAAEAAARAEAIRAKAAEEFGSADPVTAQIAAQEKAAQQARLLAASQGRRLNTIDTNAAVQGDAINQQSVGSAERNIAAQQAAQEAEMRALQAAGRVATTARPAETSAALSNIYNRGRENFDEFTVNQWGSFREGRPIPVAPIQREVSRLYNSLDPIVRQMFNEKHGKDFKYIVDLDPSATITPNEYQAIVKDLKSAANQEIQKGGYTTLPMYTRAMDEVVDTLNPEFAGARAATVVQKEAFPEELVKALDARPPLFAKTLNIADEKGAVANEILRNSGVNGTNQIFEHMKAVGRREGITDKFLSKYSHILDTLPPEQRALFSGNVEAAGANKAAQAAAERAAKADMIEQSKLAQQQTALSRAVESQRTKVGQRGRVLSQAFDNALVSKYGKAPEGTIRNLLSTTDNIPSLKSLAERMRRAGGGEAFTAHVGKELTDKLLKGDTDALRIVTESGILPKTSLDEIQRQANKLKSMEQRKTALVRALDTSSDKMRELMPSFAAALVMNQLPGGHSLIMAGALRRYFKKEMARPQDMAKLEEFMLNPQSYIEAIGKVKSAEEAADKLAQLVMSKSPNTAKEENN